MPIYEYTCKQCQHNFDTLQTIDAAPLQQCPACNELSLEKMIGAPMFQLKGSGWYATDYKDNNKSANKDPDATAASKEAKPATDNMD